MRVAFEVTLKVDPGNWPEPGRGEHTGPVDRRVLAYIEGQIRGALPAQIHRGLPLFSDCGGVVVIGKPRIIE